MCMAERGEGNGGCGSTGLPPVPGTPSQQSRQSAVESQRSGMDGQTPEGNVPPGFQNAMPQQQPQQQQANVSQNAQGFASTTNLDAGGQGCQQGCQQGNMPVMQGVQQGPAWFGAQWIPQQQTFMQQTAQARVPSLVVRVCLVDQGRVVFQI